MHEDDSSQYRYHGIHHSEKFSMIFRNGISYLWIMRVSERGQVTIPKTLRDEYGMNRNVEVEFVPTEEGLLLKKCISRSHPLKRVFGMFEGIDSTDDFIEAIRGR